MYQKYGPCVYEKCTTYIKKSTLFEKMKENKKEQTKSTWNKQKWKKNKKNRMEASKTGPNLSLSKTDPEKLHWVVPLTVTLEMRR